MKNRMLEFCRRRGLTVTTICQNRCFLPEIKDPKKKTYNFLRVRRFFEDPLSQKENITFGVL
jgi:hypothetical protein